MLLGTMKTTKVVIATTDDKTELGELIRAFGTYYVSSTEDVAQNMMQFDNADDLADFIDAEQRKGVIKDVHDPEHFDYLLDFSDKLNEAIVKRIGS